MTDSTSTERRRTGKGRRLGAVLVLLLAMLVTGAVAYNMGLSHGVAQAALASGTQGTIPPYYFYGHRPWGGGLVFPFVFIAFWFLAARALFWGRPGRGDGVCRTAYGDGPGARFDEWHRQAHERMKAPDAHA